MTPIDYIHVDRETLMLDKSDKAKLLVGLIKGFGIKGLMMSNPELAELLCCSADHISRLLKELADLIQINNPQSRYRKIFYSGKNAEVKEVLLRQDCGSRTNPTPALAQATPTISQATPAFSQATPAETTDIIKGTKGTKGTKLIFSPNSQEFRLSELLFSLILSRKSDFKKPNLQAWAKQIDLMLRADKRMPEKIEAVIRWCQTDPFWQNNILSTNKLRQQFDQLELKMIDGKTDGQACGRISSNVFRRTVKQDRDFSNQQSAYGIEINVD